ncbi:cytochrome P450 [Thamnocephalis sphaerospora]|uniref:Cytochrome P450 n=1 Tax=Thamnocephalis sphaerospora TaxID=78915 RepID=A0A4P9XL25_9FUNG|nr:cytochrome P450 [Thamnocephalis sphaerospora]|eukprot:RKP06476.1 cytochrome P450 [Thamnocephalis sphaerospora]
MSMLWLDGLASVVLTKEFALVAAVAWVLGKLVRQEYLSPLAKIPGIRPAVLSEALFVRALLKQDFNEYQRQLHDKYGPVVRIGRNSVSIADPSALRVLYATPRFQKSAQFAVFQVPVDNSFSTRDNELHKKLRRLVAPTFSLSAVLDIEPRIAGAGVDKLLERVAKCADAGDTFDLMAFFYHMTLDVIGAISFGRSFGLQEGSGSDIPQWIEHVMSICMLFTRDVINTRRADSGQYNDVLQRLIDAVDEETGDRLSDEQLISESILQLTTHLLLVNPDCMQRLYEELKSAIPDPSTNICHADVKDLPYLNGVIHESLRMRPVPATGSERTISKGGAHIAGYYLPEGCNVNASMGSIHSLESIFPNAASFKPERWIGNNEQVAEMKHALLTFSMGHRACIGRK